MANLLLQFANFFKLAPENLLVAYDEIDFDVGITRFKDGGGHGGHNGVRDIINALGGKNDFSDYGLALDIQAISLWWLTMS